MSAGRRSLLALLQRMSAREVAERCHVTPMAVSMWASGKTEPGKRSRAMLEQHCGVRWTVDEWTGRTK